jgi:surface antigen
VVTDDGRLRRRRNEDDGRRARRRGRGRAHRRGGGRWRRGDRGRRAAGRLLGGAVGNYLDQRDQKLAQQAARNALESTPSGTTTTWKNPDNGHSGAVTPKRTYQTASGQYCREYTQAINVGGKKQMSYGTACRQPDGQWKIVS